jgi:hypothetical protein
VLGRGTIIGIEEAILSGSECYTTTVLCKSTNVEGENYTKKAYLYKIKAEIFIKSV